MAQRRNDPVAQGRVDLAGREGGRGHQRGAPIRCQRGGELRVGPRGGIQQQVGGRSGMDVTPGGVDGHRADQPRRQGEPLRGGGGGVQHFPGQRQRRARGVDGQRPAQAPLRPRLGPQPGQRSGRQQPGPAHHPPAAQLRAVVDVHRVVDVAAFAPQHPIADIDTVQPRQRQQQINGLAGPASQQRVRVDAGAQRQLHLGVEPGRRICGDRPYQSQHRGPPAAAGQLGGQRRVARDQRGGAFGAELHPAGTRDHPRRVGDREYRSEADPEPADAVVAALG